MKSLISILLLITINSFSQDSVKARVIKTSEKTLVYEINKMRFVSFDCKCSLKRGDIFWIPKKRFDSLLKEAKPIRKRDIEN